MTEQADHEEAVKTLQRMVAYVEAEARRLGMSDVALLLGHAVEAVTHFTLPPILGETGLSVGERGMRDH